MVLPWKKKLTTKPGFRTTWSQQIGTQGDDTGFATTVDKDGNVYLQETPV
ncbi:MAG: hypothetical protein Ct9H300mP21_03990 [Pseudomonadota bacterium]|nr:MAG: hypothetical protein Ct9H300mP21_03990 [Pseudomonadota bacterium]